MPQLHVNNFNATLASGITAVATTLTLAPGSGARLPAPTGGDYFLLTLYQMSGATEVNHEVVRCTALSTDTCTVLRAQEGTTARAFNSADPVSMRLTAGALTPAALGAVASVSATGPLASSGGTAPTISMPAASGSTAGYLTAADWTAFNGKQAAVNGAASTITTTNLTASRALVSDASGKVGVSAITATELGYLSGVTSAIQTQLGGKQASLGFTPVQQGTGTGQLTANAIKIGWTAGSKLALTVDTTDFSYNWPMNVTGTAANITGTAAIANGGTGATTALAALTALGAYAASNPNGYISASGAPVQSVGGFTGAVTKTQLGISNVDNTADSAKPVSTAQQAALDLKANLASPTFTGTVTIPNLVVNGTSTIVNSTSVTLDDPILTLGGDTVPTVDDGKDRGIEFRWHNGTVAKLGFFGFDDSSGKLIFIPDATNTSEVFAGAKGELDAGVTWSNVLSPPTTRAGYGITDAAQDVGTLTARATQPSANSIDFNTLTNAGVYQITGNGTWTGSTNGPTAAYAYGQLVVAVNGTVVTQTYTSHSPSRVWVRAKYNASDWQPWSGMWDTNSLSGAASSIASTNLTANRALVSDASGKVAASAATATEVGYLAGVTSAIQTQISGKQASLGFTPIQQGTGTGQTSNLVKIGWTAASKLALTVDSTDFSYNWPINVTGNATNVTGVVPIANGGTGASTAAAALAALGAAATAGASFTGPVNEAKGADIASAATVNLNAATGNLVHVTGTVQISAITLAVGAERSIVFDSALILVHSAALVLPGGTNMTTTPGQVYKVIGDAGSVVRLLSGGSSANGVSETELYFYSQS